MRPRYYASRAFACSLVSRLNAAAEQRSLKVLAVIRYALYDETPVPLREQLVSGSGMRVNAEQLRSESQVVEITKQVRVSKEIHLQKYIACPRRIQISICKNIQLLTQLPPLPSWQPWPPGDHGGPKMHDPRERRRKSGVRCA